jgi:hypothetical protein
MFLTQLQSDLRDLSLEARKKDDEVKEVRCVVFFWRVGQHWAFDSLPYVFELHTCSIGSIFELMG